MTDINNPSNVIIGDDADELIRLQGTGAAAGFGGNDTIVSAINGVAPGSLIFGNTGDDYLESKGVGDSVFGGKDDDYAINDTGQALMSGDLGNDTLWGEEGLYTLFGGAGNDYLYSEEAESILLGEDDDDTLAGGEGADTFAGGEGDDYVKAGPEGASFLFGNEGGDYLLSETSDENGDADSLYGGQGNDTAVVGGSSVADNPLLVGDLGDDSLIVEANISGAILGGDISPDGQIAGTDVGDDYLYVAAGSDHGLAGNGGDDRLVLGAAVGANVTLQGGQGNDSLTGTAGAGLQTFGDLGDDYLYLVANGAELWGDNPDATECNSDTIIGVGGNNTLVGDSDVAGSDTSDSGDLLMTMAGSNNLLIGGCGDDTLDASASGPGDTLVGGAGDDYYVFGAGAVIAQDTLGINTYIGSGALDVTVTVQAQDSFGGDANFFIPGDNSNVRSIASGGIISGDAPDLLTIGSANGVTDSGGGDDTLNVGNVTGSVSGGDGNDIINVVGTDPTVGPIDGGLGDDSIAAQTVAGSVTGGEGADTLDFDSLQGGAVVSGGDGNDIFNIGTVDAGASISAGAGNEVISIGGLGTVAGEVSVAGDAGDDTLGLSSGATDNIGTTSPTLNLSGGEGNDVLQGRQFGGDILSGGAGNDQLYGGTGMTAATRANVIALDGSVSATEAVNYGDGDQLTGGAGADRFVILSLQETGNVLETALDDNYVGNPALVEGAGEEFLAASGPLAVAENFIVGTTGEYVTEVGTTPGAPNLDAGYFTSGFNVDTLTDFSISQGDVIVLKDDAFTDYEAGAGDAVLPSVYTFAGTGVLFGEINPTAGSNAVNAAYTPDVGFDGDFAGLVYGGTLTADGFDDAGRVSYDQSTGGLYIGDGVDNKMTLFAVLPTGLSFTGVDANDFIKFDDLQGGGGINVI
ncbi:beta strand repeat-containing protein [Baaleninema simplex]|uniref:beta strand repeat-containing protein n=1 Tax=Baaleninema simplex TaxID=2862350 RepID=UPI00034BB949|nr:calcium-binding protein [Baaleninema simplex]